ncbi:MAG TPA: serine/threonine-protein kinase, partial [Acidimicrobiales bacterium]
MSPEAAAGTVLAGRYRIEREIERGGFATVYLASDLRLHGKRVAVKVLSPAMGVDEAFRERFVRESAMAVELDDHPGIVPVYDAGEDDDGSLYLVMRYIEGTDLNRAINRYGPVPADTMASILDQVAGALDVAHAAGLVHRDVKPGNILLTADLRRAYLADFGLTKRVHADQALTQAHQYLGT